MIRRYFVLAAMGAAMFLTGTMSASAGSVNIDFFTLNLTNGVGTSVLSSVDINGVMQPGTFTAQADFQASIPFFTLSSASQLVDLKFKPPVASAFGGAAFVDNAISWTVSPSLIPVGETVTDVTLSLSSSNFHSVTKSGTYAGTITINTAVPEPSSLIMGSTALIALFGLVRLRARRRNA